MSLLKKGGGFFMWSALPKTQKCVVTYDNIPTAATAVAVTTGKVSLRPCIVGGTNFYQLQATCKVKEKRACHTLFFIIAINFCICTKLHCLKAFLKYYSKKGSFIFLKFSPNKFHSLPMSLFYLRNPVFFSILATKRQTLR
jgi:hypothetical protein